MIPQWTLLYNIVSPENPKWVGTGWEFFDSFEEADKARRRHIALGNVPTLRPYHELDARHLGAAHRM